MLEICLDERQLEYCKRVATDRRKPGSKWDPHGETSMRDADLLGTCVEYAFQFVHSIFYDTFNGKIFAGGDGGFDFTTPQGTTIDVKGTKETSRWMIVPERQITKDACDVYVLGRYVPQDNVVRFDGWISKKDFKLIMKHRPISAHTGYGCWISSLQPIESFINGCNSRLF